MKKTLRDILPELKTIELEIRKSVYSNMHGNYKSIFKGSGIEFSDIREYQYGDEIRTIDWKVSAKGEGTFVRIFEENKEQQLLFLLDLSHSNKVGIPQQNKFDLIRKITGVLMLSANKEKMEVGLIGFTDKKELYIRPKRGEKYIYNQLLQLFNHENISGQTDINKAIQFLISNHPRKSIVILISDFISDSNYEEKLKVLSKRHEVVIIHIQDLMEYNMPSVGIIPIKDPESNKIRWVNTHSIALKSKRKKMIEQTQTFLENFSKVYESNYTSINTQEDFRLKLIELFKVRNFHK
jgi:uncharacterized protein (DUF58 family)